MSGPQLSCRAPGPRGAPGSRVLPGSGCRGRQGVIPLPAGMERAFALLLPLQAQSPPLHKGRMWGGLDCAFLEVFRGKGGPWEHVPAAIPSLHTHSAQHLPQGLANHLPSHLAFLQKCSGVPFPRHLGGGSAEVGATVCSGGTLTCCPRSPPRTPGLCRRREGGEVARTRSKGKAI